MPTQKQGIVFTGLMPHAPVLIPEVGRGREREAGEVVDGMREVSRRTLKRSPDRLILVSPHTPRVRSGFACWGDFRICGDLGRFGAPQVKIDLPRDELIGARLQKVCQSIRGVPLDHGASVPLYYLVEAGWNGPTTLLGLAYPGEGDVSKFGTELKGVADELEGRTAFIASGDMSHALKPGAPAGFNSRANEFDEAFVASMEKGDYKGITRIDPELRELAAEDVVDSTLMAAAALGGANSGFEFLAYQGPFGVGYSVGVMFDNSKDE